MQAAIEGLAERAGRHGLEVELTVGLGIGETGRHSLELETAVYRIVQEALTNARKHGDAGRALVRIDADGHRLRVTVRDDGRGFEPDAKTNGYRLHSMRERAELLGGTPQIDSAPGRGTEITADFPPARVRASAPTWPKDRQSWTEKRLRPQHQRGAVACRRRRLGSWTWTPWSPSTRPCICPAARCST